MSKQYDVAFNAIRNHYANGTPITENQEKIRQRWSAAFALMTNYRSLTQSVPVLVDQFDVSESTAYRDLRYAIRLFGNVMKTDKEGHRYIQYELAMKTFQLAAQAGDYRTMNSANMTMVKLLGLDREEMDAPDFSKLQPSLVVTIVEDDDRARLKQLLSGGVVDFSKMREEAATVDAEIVDSQEKIFTDEDE